MSKSKTLQELQIEHSEIATYRAKCLANFQHYSQELQKAEQLEAEKIGEIQKLKQEQADSEKPASNAG